MIRWLINRINAGRRAVPEYGVGTWRRPWDAPGFDDSLMLLAAAVNRGIDCWWASEPGTCCTCGHEWIEGEVVGPVFQQYRRDDDGTVTYDPAVRRACCVCVEQQRVQGDLSLRWRDEGTITTAGGLDPVRERIVRGGYNPHDVGGE